MLAAEEADSRDGPLETATVRTYSVQMVKARGCGGHLGTLEMTVPVILSCSVGCGKPQLEPRSAVRAGNSVCSFSSWPAGDCYTVEAARSRGALRTSAMTGATYFALLIELRRSGARATLASPDWRLRQLR